MAASIRIEACGVSISRDDGKQWRAALHDHRAGLLRGRGDTIAEALEALACEADQLASIARRAIVPLVAAARVVLEGEG